MPWWDMKVGALQQVYAVLSRDPGVSGSANPALFRRNDTGTDTEHKE